MRNPANIKALSDTEIHHSTSHCERSEAIQENTHECFGVVLSWTVLKNGKARYGEGVKPLHTGFAL